MSYRQVYNIMMATQYALVSYYMSKSNFNYSNYATLLSNPPELCFSKLKCPKN